MRRFLGFLFLIVAMLITILGIGILRDNPPRGTYRPRPGPTPATARERPAPAPAPPAGQGHEPLLLRIFNGLVEGGRAGMQHDHANIVIDFVAGPGGIIFDQRDGQQEDVHDHATQESIKKSYAKLEQWIETHPELVISEKDTLAQVKDYLFKNLEDTEQIEKTYSTVKIIKKHKGYLAAIKKTELEVLSHVWSRIQAPINQSVRKELSEHLMEQLAEASINYDADLARCLTGRISRMMQSLESIDAEEIVNITSTAIIKRELSNKVPVLINSYMEKNWTEQQKERYNNEDETLATELRQHVKDKLEQDYIDTNLLTQRQFEQITTGYLQEI